LVRLESSSTQAYYGGKPEATLRYFVAAFRPAVDLLPLILLSADAAPPDLPVPFLVEASGAGRGCALRQLERRSEEQVSTEMIRVTVEIREGGFSRRVQITAPYIERAPKIAGDGVPGRRVRLLRLATARLRA
jgi:hypothetical protein